MNPQIKGIAFDLEGTIVNVESLHHEAHIETAARFGINIDLKWAIDQLPHFVGGPDEIVAKEIAHLFPSYFSVDQFVEMKASQFEEKLAKITHICVHEDFKGNLGWIQRQGLKIAIGSMTRRRMLYRLLELASLSREFEENELVAFEDVARAKPFSDVYVETAHRMSISADEQIVFEDSVVGVTAAKGAGSRVFAIPTIKDEEYRRNLLRAGAEHILSGWDDREIRKLIKESI